MIQRGEIYWVNLDPTIGTEIKKTRPALIISNNQNNQAANTVTVLPITSKANHVYPFEVALPKNKFGLPEESKIKANQIRTVDKTRLGQLLGRVNNDILIKTQEALCLHLGIESKS